MQEPMLADWQEYLRQNTNNVSMKPKNTSFVNFAAVILGNMLELSYRTKEK